MSRGSHGVRRILAEPFSARTPYPATRNFAIISNLTSDPCLLINLISVARRSRIFFNYNSNREYDSRANLVVEYLREKSVNYSNYFRIIFTVKNSRPAKVRGKIKGTAS